ncbi:MAG: YceI family protein [Flavobacteriales bacterium]|nr:YceI family protein [Flavobacteriales bacterium]
MKSTVLSVAALALLFVACGPSDAEREAARMKAKEDSLAAFAAAEHVYAVDAANSQLQWTGTMLGIKKHRGVVSIAEGKFSLKGGQVISGSFNVDLNTIAALDSAYAPDGSPQGTRANLIGHLKSPAFFDVANYPQASFEVTGVDGNTALGTFTVRGKSDTEKVTDIVVTEENGVAKVTGKLAFDRQKYGVAWDSGSKDAVLSDNIDLEITLTGTAAN